jgi:gluconolactonase
MDVSRRRVFAGAGAVMATSVLAGSAVAQSFGFKPNQRYPDPAVEVLDPSFLRYRLYSSTVEQVATGMRWAEGPVYFPDEGYLLCSDIPNNRIMKYSEKDGTFTVFRSPSNYANGNTRDRQGRLVTCEHSVTRRITRTEKNGKVTVLADKYEGKRLSAPTTLSSNRTIPSGLVILCSASMAIGKATKKSPSRQRPTFIALQRMARLRP